MSSVCPPLAFVTLTIDIGHCSFSLLNIALPLAIVMIAVMERVNALPMHLFKQIPVQLNPHMHATISLLIYSLNCWAADSSPHYRSQHLPGRRSTVLCTVLHPRSSTYRCPPSCLQPHQLDTKLALFRTRNPLPLVFVAVGTIFTDISHGTMA